MFKAVHKATQDNESSGSTSSSSNGSSSSSASAMVGSLPMALLLQVSDYFSTKELATGITRASRSWHQMYSSEMVWIKKLSKDFFGFNYNTLKSAEYAEKLLPPKIVYGFLFHYFNKNLDDQFQKILQHSVILGKQFFPPLYLKELPIGVYSGYLLGYWLNEAAKLGNFDLVQYLMTGIDKEQRVGADQQTLYNAARPCCMNQGAVS